MNENTLSHTDKLTINQLRFISQRAWHETSGETAAAVGVHPDTVTRWRRESAAFVAAEKSVFTGDIKRTQEIIARTRDEAALTLKELLKARDKRVRRQTAVDLLKFGGLVQGESVEHGVSSALAELLSKAKEEG